VFLVSRLTSNGVFKGNGREVLDGWMDGWTHFRIDLMIDLAFKHSTCWMGAVDGRIFSQPAVMKGYTIQGIEVFIHFKIFLLAS
jgi:hypothetical protein